MIERLAISGYRSLREISLALGQISVITGPNGSGKSSLYRALRLLADVAQGRLITSLAREGGFHRALWAGPEKYSRAMLDGEHPVQPTMRSKPAGLKLGFSSAEIGYAIDLGFPKPGGHFDLDPEIKREAMWSGGRLSRSNLYADRHEPLVNLRSNETGEWKRSNLPVSEFDSMITHCADPIDGLELLLLREKMRGWRFYDNLRSDRDAPARQAQVITFTPAMASDGSNLSAAMRTIEAIGDNALLQESIDDAFPGSKILGGDRLGMSQPGLLRALDATELSDGTLRYLMLVAALLSPRPPELIVLNEPESSLHPALIEPLGRLVRHAAKQSQIIVVSHSEALVEALSLDERTRAFVLEKRLGETRLAHGDEADWTWPNR